MKYMISIVGCDDTTEFEYQLTNKQWELVKLLSAASHEASGYPCMPVLDIAHIHNPLKQILKGD